MAGRAAPNMNPVTPAEVLVEEFLRPLGMSRAALARGLGISPARISAIVQGRRGVSADTALRLGLFFGTCPRSGSLSRPSTTLRLRGLP